MERKRILIVEDDDLLGLVCALIFEGGGGFLTKIVPGAICIAATVRKFLPHLILLDLHLRDGNGMDILADLRSHGEFDGIPIALMTGSVSRSEASEGRLFNGVPIIAKPFTPAELLAFVATLLGPRHSLLRPAA
jgi:DNA-binding response OmpR family regulator